VFVFERGKKMSIWASWPMKGKNDKSFVSVIQKFADGLLTQESKNPTEEIQKELEICKKKIEYAKVKYAEHSDFLENVFTLATYDKVYRINKKQGLGNNPYYVANLLTEKNPNTEELDKLIYVVNKVIHNINACYISPEHPKSWHKLLIQAQDVAKNFDKPLTEHLQKIYNDFVRA